MTTGITTILTLYVSESVQFFVIPRNYLGQNSGVGSLSLLQGIVPTQGLNLGLPHCRWILYHLSHQGSPRILKWVAYPFSRGSSQPRNWTRVSCLAGGFFTNWAIRLNECYGNFISTTIKQEENSKQIFFSVMSLLEIEISNRLATNI